MSAPSFEQSISDEEKKRQLLNHLSQGINVPDFLVLSEYYKENQIKEIKYLDLNNFYKNMKIENKETEELFKKNKNFFVEKVKNINLTELKPINLIGKNEYNESYFKKIDTLENRILDGETLDNIQKEYNLQIKKINNIGNKITKENTNGEDIELVKKIYSLKILKKPNLINHNNKYYLGEISSITNKEKSINNPEVKDLLKKQIQLKNKIINNNEIAKNISLRKFNKDEFQRFASDNSLQINSIKLENINENKIFSESLIRRIFETNDGEFKLISSSALDKNFIIFSEKTKRNPINPDNKIYKEYLQKAKFNLTKEIYEIYDKSINTKYKVVTNKKVIDRIKNSF